jgi:outer membrane protein assembly factor BamD (BamD/ComL family)
VQAFVGLADVCSGEEKFYDENKKYLSDNGNEASEKIYSKGVNRAHNGDFVSARNYFDSAYQLCDSGYQQKRKFGANRDAMDVAIEAKKLLGSERYEEAKSKFREASNKAATSDLQHLLSRQADSAGQ